MRQRKPILWLTAVVLLALAGIAWGAVNDVWQRDQDPNSHIVTKTLIVRDNVTAGSTYVEGGRSAALATRIGANATNGPFISFPNSGGTKVFTFGSYGTAEVWGYMDPNGNFEVGALGIGLIPAANNNGHFAIPSISGTPSSTPSTIALLRITSMS